MDSQTFYQTVDQYLEVVLKDVTDEEHKKIMMTFAGNSIAGIMKGISMSLMAYQAHRK